MDPNQRNTIVVVMVGVALVAGGIGFAVGRSSAPEPAERVTASPALTLPPVAPAGDPVSPAPTAVPEGDVLSTSGRILAPGAQQVLPASETAVCTSLVTPGTTGDCGEVQAGDERVVWVVESRAVGDGGIAWQVRVLTFVADAGGWVVRLEAGDAEGTRWSDVGVASADLTGDGGQELVVGFRNAGTEEALGYDVVSITPDGVAEVLAHAGPLLAGSVTADGGLTDYGAVLGAGEAPCCPSTFEQRMFAFGDGLFRVAEAVDVPASTVPASQAG
ncbi:MAG: hypothetical protein WEA54_00375 [Actinomycetota bacterium]